MAENEAQPSTDNTPNRRDSVYSPFETMVNSTVTEIISHEPKVWWQTAYKNLRRMQQSVEKSPQPAEIKEYISTNIGGVIETLKKEMDVMRPDGTVDPDKFTAERANILVHEISDILAFEQPEKEPVVIETIPLEEIVTRSEHLPSGYRCSIATEEVNSLRLKVLKIYSPVKDSWFTFPIPVTDTMVHKGGFPRVVLKILADADPKTIESELPPNDFDVIAWGEEKEALDNAALLGVDTAGVEMIQEKNFTELCKTRDLDLNGCFIGQEGLVFSTAAKKAAQTGHISPIPSIRGLYGNNMFFHDGIALMTPRDMMRAVKFVAEGKAISFDFKQVNKQIDIGIYGLVLAERFIHKPNSIELLNRMYYLLSQTGQIRNGEKDIWQYLDSVHERYPFFEVNKEPLTEIETAKWLIGRLGKQAKQTFRMLYAIPSGNEMTRIEGDTQPVSINLQEYEKEMPLNKAQHRLLQLIEGNDETEEDKKQEFIRRCHQRTEQFKEESETAA